MCDTRSDHLVSLAKAGADIEHELHQALREDREGMALAAVRESLEERGDYGALRFLERVAGEASGWSHDEGAISEQLGDMFKESAQRLREGRRKGWQPNLNAPKDPFDDPVR